MIHLGSWSPVHLGKPAGCPEYTRPIFTFSLMSVRYQGAAPTSEITTCRSILIVSCENISGNVKSSKTVRKATLGHPTQGPVFAWDDKRGLRSSWCYVFPYILVPKDLLACHVSNSSWFNKTFKILPLSPIPLQVTFLILCFGPGVGKLWSKPAVHLLYNLWPKNDYCIIKWLKKSK